MKLFWQFILLAFIALACAPNYDRYKADRSLDAQAQQAFLYEIIRYMGRMPAAASVATKFDSKFDAHYHEQAAQHRLDYYYEDKKAGDVFFMASRIAPSLKVKRVAIGGKLRRDAQGNISYYEEVFRTWKMTEDELAKKAPMLFVKMIKGQDLSPYYPENSGKEEFIEFPNEEVYFDVKQRIWVSRRENPLAPYEEAKRKLLEQQMNPQ